jgi:hypothetical protein
MEIPPHLDLTHAAGCKHPRLSPCILLEDGSIEAKHITIKERRLIKYNILADDYPVLPGYLIIPILYHTNNILQPIFIHIKDYTTAII